ncbi:MAG: pyruvate dehydrogenase complex dihydrolipoamide acetyltransferase [Cyclobacteriaceae bacterium]|nr:pyruvate dehydrogenase complex dihydrolipoamide acetyltransferase [Cyclobacteriaceae bacterium]MDW8330152.1 pyruvate dehydrogenase complex dihydrolipoamide acetyltransferase [Cyclobacteriaceae bacterium]
MAEIIRMPKMSDTMTEGVIAKWHKKVGDQVKAGELMAEIETDKATMDYESYNEGTILYLGAKEGETVKVDDVLAIIGKKGEDYQALLQSAKQSGEKGGSQAESVKKEEPVKPAIADTSGIKAEIVLMPKMSDTMTEGVIAAWHKKVGDPVKSGELLAEIETDKATMEYESYNSGTLLYIGAEAGKSVPVNGVLAIIGEPNADWQTLLKAHQAKAGGPVTTAAEKQETKTTTEPKPVTASKHEDEKDGRIKASPLARKMARELGYDLRKIKGTGDHGRITKRDVENYKPEAEAPAKATTPAFVVPQVVGKESFEEIPVSQMRKTIARRLSESMFTAPHFYLTMEINMDKAIEARKSINEVSPVKISFNDMVIKAVAAALRQHPDVNVSWLGDKIRKNHHIHIGVAVAVKDGLVVPVVRFADSKSLSHIAAEVKELAQKAHDKKLQPTDWEGSTFTISNLGMFGIEEFTAIINPPDACILAVGGIKETAVVKNGQLVPGNVMKVTLSCDHRAVDGAVGAAFLKTLKGLLEDPVRILI